MNLPRWSGKRRRSTLGSDSFSGSGDDSSDSPLLPSGPVLSPPPGLGRSLNDQGRPPAAAAGTPRLSGDNRGGGHVAGPRVGGRCPDREELALFALRTGFIVPFSGLLRQSFFCSDTDVLSAYIQRPPASNVQVDSGSFDPEATS